MKHLISAFFLFFLFGCSKTFEADIPQEKMVDILYDLTVASSARSTSNKRDSIQYVVSYQQLLKKHGIDSLQFVNAQEQYRKKPEVYAAIYDSVNQRLQIKLQELRASKPDETEENTIQLIDVKKVSFSRRNNK